MALTKKTQKRRIKAVDRLEKRRDAAIKRNGKRVKTREKGVEKLSRRRRNAIRKA